jgi:DNA repair protein RadD
VVALGADRRSWLLFCAGVEHATHVAEALRRRAVRAATIFGDTPRVERDRIIAVFKRGEIRALASMGVLTTGFNAPAVDLIAMLRPTKSTGLYVQMVGRGTRLAPDKTDCLVLDFAGNVARHGPVDAVNPTRPGSGKGEAPVKTCPECKSLLATAVRLCPDCGHAFAPPTPAVKTSASTLAILSTGAPQWVAVDRVTYHRHEKRGGRPSLRVDYQCGLVRHREWVCLEHDRYPRRKAVAWWQRRAPGTPIPRTVAEALRQTDRLAVPAEIAVRPKGCFTEIVQAKFAPCSTIAAPTAATTQAVGGDAAPPARTTANGDSA